MDNTDFEFVPGKYTGTNLKYAGYLYKKNKVKDSFTYFRFSTSNCPARLSMSSSLSIVINKPGPHNHEPPSDQILQENFRKRVLQDFKNNPTEKIRSV